MGSKQHHFVFVHGAGHGAWCWVKVVPALEKAGHRVTTIDLLSAGENNAVEADDVTSPEQYDQPMTDLLVDLPDDEKVILVCHSLGGLTVSRMAERFPKKICVAVFLAAHMTGISEAGRDTMRNPEYMPRLAFKFHSKDEGGPPTSAAFTPSLLEEYFYNTCSPKDLSFAIDRIKRLPMSALIPPTNLTAENYGSVPRIYVVALWDKAIPPKCQRKFVKFSPPREVIELEADHSVFFSAVDSIVKILNDAAAKYGSS